MFSVPNRCFRFPGFLQIHTFSPFSSRNLASTFPPSNTHVKSPKPKQKKTQKKKMKMNKLAQFLVKNDSISTSNYDLSEQQKMVLKTVEDGRSVFITGPGGTGKSFLLKHCIRVLKEIHPPGQVFVTASTGVAACALSGQTLHSFAGIGLGTGDRDELLLKAAKNKLASKRWKTAKVLVIDEVSMIDGEVFDHLEFIARRLRARADNNGKGKHKFADNSGGEEHLWGGIQLIVTGDFFQLPPVHAANPDKEFAFEAKCWHASFDLHVELTQVFRQSDPQMVELLQGIRGGRVNIDHLQLLNRCIVKNQLGNWDSTITRLYPRNEDVKRINDERLRSLGGKIIKYIALDEGDEPWKKQLKQGIAPEELEICSGARVMLLKNIDPGVGLVNGATGTVTGFVETKKKTALNLCGRMLLPRVRFDNNLEWVVEPDSWDVIEGEVVLARRRQVPLMLAWALSIHKCQGMTLDRLHTDLSRAFGCGMVYVALSRVRSLKGLSLSGFSPAKIRAHPKVLQFSQGLF